LERLSTEEIKMSKYDEIVDFFGSPNEVAEYFDVSVFAVYQWKDKVPDTRYREYKLVKELRGEICQSKD